MDYTMLQKTVIFKGCTAQELERLSVLLEFREKSYRKGLTIYHMGQIIKDFGLVLEGKVQIENYDMWGNKSILGQACTGEIFAESYSCIPGQPLMVDVVALEDCRILMVDCNRNRDSDFLDSGYRKFIQNLMTASARKNLNLSHRIFYTSSKTIRGRLMAYFSDRAAEQHSNAITIPMDRQQLADYLSVERSALSKELGKMKRDGLIEYRKNRFILHSDFLEE